MGQQGGHPPRQAWLVGHMLGLQKQLLGMDQEGEVAPPRLVDPGGGGHGPCQPTEDPEEGQTCVLLWSTWQCHG